MATAAPAVDALVNDGFARLSVRVQEALRDRRGTFAVPAVDETFHRLATPLTAYDPGAVPSLKRLVQRDKRNADGTVPAWGTPGPMRSDSRGARGISLFFPLGDNAAAYVFAHQELRRYTEHPGVAQADCFVSTAPAAGLPGGQAQFDRWLGAPEPFALHAVVTSNECVSFEALDRVAKCANVEASWLPCQFQAAADAAGGATDDADWDAPDTDGDDLMMAVEPLLYAVIRLSTDAQTAFEAAVLLWHACKNYVDFELDIKRLVEWRGGVLAPMLVEGRRLLRSQAAVKNRFAMGVPTLMDAIGEAAERALGPPIRK